MRFTGLKTFRCTHYRKNKNQSSIMVLYVSSCCCCEVISVVSDSVRPHRRQPTRLLSSWDSPGKNTGMGCHFLLLTSLHRNDINVNSQHLVRYFSSLIRQYSLTTVNFHTHTALFAYNVFHLIYAQRTLLLSRFSRVQPCATPQTAAHQAPPSLDSLGKNTRVGCHFLLQCMKVKSESEVAQSCPTLRDPMDCSLPGSSAHGIFQARVLEWVAIAFSTSKHCCCCCGCC